MTLELELRDLATQIAKEAGELARRRRHEGVHLAATKSTMADIVTDADREVEALIRARVDAARPDDGFLGEESAAEPGSSGITWVVDPIDGTVNYAYGMPAYNVSIAAVRGTPDPAAWEALAGAVNAPALGEMFTAARGHGAWLGETRLAVTSDTPAGALLATGFGYDPSTHDGDIATVRQVMPMARDLRRSGSAALDLAYVAAGRLDGYFERGLSPWDFAAGALLVTEAGGRVSRLDADSPRPMLIAGGTQVHTDLLKRLDKNL
ncbi:MULTISPECIES: inositol monophosphatase family protein [unclassified Microbacterium]|uniref:inositol monophosphatase family protein n=1 Tax=unclassified Microbacterium TaxID=2609290 RepID=UPI000EA9592D|nr:MULTISPECIES: inositol monophosphatase family protein [unclassified Microbacterium]MBT2484962.1 inositol monophosphatase [Microbacterium sp. ISL-108]RKN67819.1 inositol monophosphatase [Microbacterium sp. CGR2]